MPSRILASLAAVSATVMLGAGPAVQTADEPEIVISLHGPRGDSVDVFLAGDITRRFALAEGVAAVLGSEGATARESDLYEDTATVRLGGRIAIRDRGGWRIELDTLGIQRAVALAGRDAFTLAICRPFVAARLRASRPPDASGSRAGCQRTGDVWALATDETPLRIELVITPRESRYWLFVAVTAALAVALGLVARVAGGALRRGAFRYRTGAAIWIGILGGIGPAIGLPVLAAVTGFLVGPVDNLALARDLGLGLAALAGLAPAVLGALPGTVFAILLLRSRPWGNRPPMPVMGGPPMPPGSASPPRLPWER